MTGPPHEPASGARLRPVRDSDAPGLIRLVGGVFAEYEGCVLDLEGEERQLRRPARAYDRFWVLERRGEIVGSVACEARDGAAVELKRMYLHRRLRGSGLADRLLGAVEARARELGATRIELWSDARFSRAHRFYRKRGFRSTGETRELHDASNTTELRFLRDLRGFA